MARSYQPGMLVVDRTVTGEYENYTTPEQEVPNEPLPFPWETCMTMGDSWSYVPNDNYKSSHRADPVAGENCIQEAETSCLISAPDPMVIGIRLLTAACRISENGWR